MLKRVHEVLESMLRILEDLAKSFAAQLEEREGGKRGRERGRERETLPH